MAFRIFFSVLLLTSALFAPFYLTVTLTIVGMLYFSNYFEAVAVMTLSDLLHAVPQDRFFHFFFVSTALTAITLGVIEFSKIKLKFYPKR